MLNDLARPGGLEPFFNSSRGPTPARLVDDRATLGVLPRVFGSRPAGAVD